MNPLIINLAPTGMIPKKENTPFVPESPQEIIEQVHEAYEVGITIVHLHARENGTPTYKASIYKQILDGLRKHCPDLVTGISHSGRMFKSFEERSEAIELQADLGSLILSSLNFIQQESVNSPDMILSLIDKMAQYGVKPELEVFDSGMINFAKYLIKKNVLTPPHYFNILVGNMFNVQAEIDHIGLLIRDLPENSYWSLAGIGNTQLQVNTLAVAFDGGVRVGLEDNIYLDSKRQVKATNIQMVKRIHQIAEMFERPIMKASEFGEMGFYNLQKRG